MGLYSAISPSTSTLKISKDSCHGLFKLSPSTGVHAYITTPHFYLLLRRTEAGMNEMVTVMFNDPDFFMTHDTASVRIHM